MKKTVEVSAPGKLMLFGEHAVVYDRPCIVIAVNQRLTVRTSFYPGNKIIIDAPNVGIVGYETEISRLGKGNNIPKGVRFIEIAVANFFDLYKVSSGLKIETRSDFSSEFGFGSSSAVTVGTVTSLFRLFQIDCSKKDIFDLCFETVFSIQGLGSGFDIASAIWGGALYFVNRGKKIEPLKIKKLPLLVGYTGVKADTAPLVNKVASLRERNPKIVDSMFDTIKDIVEDARVCLEKQDLKGLGELMNLNQGLLDSLGVGSDKLSCMINAARESGAYGAKLSGAGGGDCMIALAPSGKKQNVESAMKVAGGFPVNIKFEPEGVKIVNL